MSSDLIKLDEYGLFTFATTTHALKAEKVLQKAGMDFVIMPTPREISASCGLSIKVVPEKWEIYADALLANQVKIDGMYTIKQLGKRKEIRVLPQP